MSRTVDEVMADMDNATLDELVMVANSSDVKVPGADKDETAASTEVASAATPAASSDAGKPAEAKATETEAPIATRDGKHTIPYEVLAGTRAKADAAEATAKAEAERAAAAEAKLAELQAQLDAAKAGSTPALQTAEGTLSPEELAEMEQDFPMMAKAYKAMQSQLAQQQQITAQSQQEIRARQQSEEARSVQDLIDANPKLAFLQAQDPAGWEKAVAIDYGLTSVMPDKAARFKAVVAAYEAQHGAINAPAATQAKPDAKQSIDAVLAKASAAVPNSLSDIPGGAPVAGGEIGNVENMSASEIAANLMTMTPKARDAYLNSLG